MTSKADRPAPQLPASFDRYDLDVSTYREILEAVLPLAARYGTDIPAVELIVIADQCGAPVEHQIFQHTESLYEEALRYALAQLWPPKPGSFEKSVETAPPVQSMRELVLATMSRFQANDNAVRLLVSENVFSEVDVSHRADVLDQSPVILQIDRVLMRGHDLGAFRTGVSAEDVYVLISSLCSFAVTQGQVFYALYGMNAAEPHNQDGLAVLAADAVVAFLTTVMPTSQGNSYTHSSPSKIVGDSVAASLYDITDYGSLEQE